MLNVLRENFKRTPYLKVVLAVVGVGLVAYLGNFFLDAGGGVSGNWAARVDGVEIPIPEFRRRAGQVDNRYRQLLGDSYEQFRRPEQVAMEAIESLVAEELIQQDAARLGLRASKQEIADLLVSNPQFQDPVTGQFVGADRYKELVGGNSGAAAYEELISRDIIRQRWLVMVGQAVSVDESELADTFRKRTVKTAMDYVIVKAEEQDSGEEVSDAEVQQWYEAHPDDYQRGESRRIRFVVVERDKLRDGVEIDEEAIVAYYDANQDKYTHPEQRSARHILARVEAGASDEAKQQAREKAELALARVKAGEDFAAVATELSDDTFSAANGGELGFFSRPDMVAPFSEAAFSTAPGEFAEITETAFGFHAIQVLEARPQGLTPLDDVREDIRRDLAVQKAQELVLSEANRLKQSMGETGERLAQVAEEEGLEVQSRLVARGDRLQELGAAPDFLGSVNQMQAGALSAPLRLAAGMALVTVDEVLPPSVAPLAEVREQVIEDVVEDRGRRIAIDLGQRALDQNNEFTEVAAVLGLEVQESGDLAPGQRLPGVSGPVPELERRLFEDRPSVGDRAVIGVPDGALVYQVSRREPFDPLRFESEKATLRTELASTRQAQYGQVLLDRLRQSRNVEVNSRVIGIN